MQNLSFPPNWKSGKEAEKKYYWQLFHYNLHFPRILAHLGSIGMKQTIQHGPIHALCCVARPLCPIGRSVSLQDGQRGFERYIEMFHHDSFFDHAVLDLCM